MIICKKCKIEMKCSQTGTTCLFNPTHAYAGDSFICPNCKSEIVQCNDNPYYYQKIHHNNNPYPESHILKMSSFIDNSTERKNNE